MRNIHFEGIQGTPVTPEEQKERIRQVIQEGLTERQREILIAYYFQEKSILQIARELGVYKSTVWRTLVRAEERLRMFLKF